MTASTGPREAGADEEFLAQLFKGGELLAAGKIVEAKEHLERAHHLAPKNEKAQNLLGLTYFKLGLFDRASGIYEVLVNENPVDPTLRVNLGLVYLKTNALARAVKEFETATDLEPEHKKAHNYLGLALAQIGEYGRAKEHFVRAGSEAMAEKMARALEAQAPPPGNIAVAPPPPSAPPSFTPPVFSPSASAPFPPLPVPEVVTAVPPLEPPPPARASAPRPSAAALEPMEVEEEQIEVMADEDGPPPDELPPEEGPRRSAVEIAEEAFPRGPRAPLPLPGFEQLPLGGDWGAQLGAAPRPSSPPAAETSPQDGAFDEMKLAEDEGPSEAGPKVPTPDDGPLLEATEVLVDAPPPEGYDANTAVERAAAQVASESVPSAPPAPDDARWSTPSNDPAWAAQAASTQWVEGSSESAWSLAAASAEEPPAAALEGGASGAPAPREELPADSSAPRAGEAGVPGDGSWSDPGVAPASDWRTDRTGGASWSEPGARASEGAATERLDGAGWSEPGAGPSEGAAAGGSDGGGWSEPGAGPSEGAAAEGSDGAAWSEPGAGPSEGVAAQGSDGTSASDAGVRPAVDGSDGASWSDPGAAEGEAAGGTDAAWEVVSAAAAQIPRPSAAGQATGWTGVTTMGEASAQEPTPKERWVSAESTVFVSEEPAEAAAGWDAAVASADPEGDAAALAAEEAAARAWAGEPEAGALDAGAGEAAQATWTEPLDTRTDPFGAPSDDSWATGAAPEALPARPPPEPQEPPAPPAASWETTGEVAAVPPPLAVDIEVQPQPSVGDSPSVWGEGAQLFAPLQTRRMRDLGPQAAQALELGVDGPFHFGPQGLAVTVNGELLTRVFGLVAVAGAVDVKPEPRRYRGRATEQPFGEGPYQLQRATGRGVLHVELGSAQFQAIDLDDEGAYLREERVFAFEEAIAFENGRLTAEGGLALELVHLKGQGRLLLSLEGPMNVMAVPTGSPLVVPLRRLVGWYGHVSPRLMGFAGQGAVELTGEGFALLGAT